MPLEFTVDWFTNRMQPWHQHCAHLRDRPSLYLEIGSHEGRSVTRVLEHFLTHPASKAHCVDPWTNREEIERRFDSNIVASGQSHRVIKHKQESWKQLRWFGAVSFDLIYVDGYHEAMNALEDAILAFRLLKQGGIMVFDDYEWADAAVQKYGIKHHPRVGIDAFLKVYGPFVEVLHKEYQVFVRKL